MAVPREMNFLCIAVLFCLLFVLSSASTSGISAKSLLLAEKRKDIGRTSLTSGFQKVLYFRGGFEDTDSDDAYDEEDSDIDEDDDFDDDDEDFEGDFGGDVDIDEADFKGESILVRMKTAWKKTPPISKIYVLSSMSITIGAWAFKNNQWPQLLLMDWDKVLKKLQVWRLVTSFLYFGNFGLDYILTLHFVWTYLGQLEKLHFRKPADFFVMLAFGMTVLHISLLILKNYLSPNVLGHNLSCFLVYIWAKKYEGNDVNVMDLFHMSAELLPWFFVAQTLVLTGELPIADIIGIAAGHMYHYLNLKKMTSAPEFLQRIFEIDSIKMRYERYEEEYGN
uniref:Derlin n=1 Tax=Fibrocapsa japonica TaxID=94617 RepID=A0A7S2Y3M2_9STRA|mmetsp:Transcript_5567/g.8436  ORF Transcript_5567/g.8436 Transcript_5567/m.8436 type:complete len:336 (+) Transcript_5567:56-1063(+)|eukprot:CAMPEP_0113944230 /NCGR_PEP_ID=MMETSP1339-20121228/31935_1 /TAXON_ID=94617 /ORGANISM="Fibrocapsa japonica" /LENGTH=335 /DNA_ID=CAMNT_0000949357 /DNA_START=55 /DNA_END=1062 /DNA_ORIENTATION=+ /assembly_acc=CAM_ASM_000762